MIEEFSIIMAKLIHLSGYLILIQEQTQTETASHEWQSCDLNAD